MLSGNRAAGMPSVGLRRTTRVFGVVKGVDGARVLRSGRRLWPEAGDGRLKRANDGDEWFHSIIKTTTNNKNHSNNNNKNHSNNSSVVKCKENGWANEAKSRRQEVLDTKIEVPERVKSDNLGGDGQNKMFRVVYTRKRKRHGGVDKQESLDGKRYRIQFSRRQRKNKEGDSESMVSVECPPDADLTVVVEGSCSDEFVSFLSLVLTYIKRVGLRLSELAAFLLSEPIGSVFASNGICFLRVCVYSFAIEVAF